MDTLHALRAVRHAAHPERQASTLIILLPGALQVPEDFESAGFIDALREGAPGTDLLLADLGLVHIGEVNDSAILGRIDAALIQPARRCGYRRIWLAGISIGGLLAMAYVAHYSDQVQGLGLLSPYPGNRLLLREIAAAGGIGHWHAANAGFDCEQAMWRWLQGGATPLPVYLGYGSEDRFAAGIAQVAGSSRVTSVEVVTGAHDWATWSLLWRGFLARVVEAKLP